MKKIIVPADCTSMNLEAPIDFLLRGVSSSGEQLGLELMDDYCVRTVMVKPHGPEKHTCNSMSCSDLFLSFQVCVFVVIFRFRLQWSDSCFSGSSDFGLPMIRSRLYFLGVRKVDGNDESTLDRGWGSDRGSDWVFFLCRFDLSLSPSISFLAGHDCTLGDQCFSRPAFTAAWGSGCLSGRVHSLGDHFDHRLP